MSIERSSSENSQESLSTLQRKLLLLSALILSVIFIAVAIISFLYRQEVQDASRWVLENFGFGFLAGLVFLSDTVISPLPPDVILFVISNSPLADQWPLYVGIIALVSTTAGYTAWGLGYIVSKQPWVPTFLVQFASKNRDQVESYGAWAVALGALTPFPFSLTCWSAGFLHMNLRTFSLGALVRIPRVFFYYWVIHSAQLLPGLI